MMDNIIFVGTCFIVGAAFFSFGAWLYCSAFKMILSAKYKKHLYDKAVKKDTKSD